MQITFELKNSEYHDEYTLSGNKIDYKTEYVEEIFVKLKSGVVKPITDFKVKRSYYAEGDIIPINFNFNHYNRMERAITEFLEYKDTNFYKLVIKCVDKINLLEIIAKLDLLLDKYNLYDEILQIYVYHNGGVKHILFDEFNKIVNCFIKCSKLLRIYLGAFGENLDKMFTFTETEKTPEMKQILGLHII